MDNMLYKCTLCPRNCKVNRGKNENGFCGAGINLRVARAKLHFWEEPCISAQSGSGTIFFSNCTLKCVFCQNRKISHECMGEEITPKRLSELMLSLQDDGALNINFVTPTHFIPQIIQALEFAKCDNLKIPVIYNTSGYEKASTIKLLDGYVDVYLPDFKYYNDKYAIKYSKAPQYFKYTSEAIEEMVRQTGRVVFDKDGIIKRGTIVRHLMLPGLLFDSKKILDYLYSTYGDLIFFSIMNQYTPIKNFEEFPELNKKISWEYYNCLIDYALKIGIKNAYIQDKETSDVSFIPEFYNNL